MNGCLKLIVATAFTLFGLPFSQQFTRAASLVLDQDFRPPVFAQPVPPQRVVLLPNGKFLVFFNTNTLTDQRTGAITRYQADGTLDASFSFSTDYNSVSAAALTGNGQLIVAAIQSTYSQSFGTEQILRLNGDGSIDSSFNVQVVHPEAYQTVRAIVIQPDGSILVAGGFDTFAGAPVQRIVRLLADGTIDSGFIPPQFSGGFYGVYAKPVVLDNGKILIAGDFTQVDGASNLGIARLDSNGIVDMTFQAS